MEYIYNKVSPERKKTYRTLTKTKDTIEILLWLKSGDGRDSFGNAHSFMAYSMVKGLAIIHWQSFEVAAPKLDNMLLTLAL